MTTIEMTPVQTSISFRRYVGMSDEARQRLGTVRIVPPRLGRPGFGHIIVVRPASFVPKRRRFARS